MHNIYPFYITLFITFRARSQPSLDDDDGFGPPPMDFENDDEEEDFSRGYDLDDMMQHQIPATTYNVYGHTMNRTVYTQALSTRKGLTFWRRKNLCQCFIFIYQFN